MYKISIYGCAMFKKLVCQWVNDADYSHIPQSASSNAVCVCVYRYLLSAWFCSIHRLFV